MTVKNPPHDPGRRGAQRRDPRPEDAVTPGLGLDEVSPAGPPGAEHAALDQQQALLVGVLLRARGGPVSYAQLRDAGIEYPASVVSELELSGLPLERCYEGPLSARRLLGVRLNPQHTPASAAGGADGEIRTPAHVLEGVREAFADVEASAAAAAIAERARRTVAWLQPRARIASRAALHAARTALAAAAALGERARLVAADARVEARAERWSSRVADVRARSAPRAPGNSARRRWLAPAALIAVTALFAALAAGALTGAGRGHAAHAHGTSRASGSAAHAVGAPSAPARSPAQPPSPPVPATPVSPVLAAQLEAHGHELLEAGAVEGAIPELQRALLASGESLRSCLEPVSETCLNYAYALYDLGRALRLDRQPAAAVLILERRLQIANQRATVQSELGLARLEAGRRAPVASATG